ncbi:hypothetical protein WA556_001854, partial [Blastocystis sp. ATCC 50177/Nand II]
MKFSSSSDEEMDKESELETVNNSYKKLQQYVDKLQEEVYSLREEKSVFEADNAKLREEMKVMSEELQSVKEQLQESQASKMELQDRVESAVSDQGTTETKYQAMITSIQKLEDDLDAVTKERDALKKENETLHNAKPEEQPPKEEMKDDSAKIAELEGMVQALKKENKELKDKKEELIKQLDDSREREVEMENRLSNEMIGSSSSSSDEDILAETRVSALQRQFESGSVRDKRSKAQLIDALAEKEREIAELKKQMEGEHRVQIVLPPVTGEEKGSCPPAYVDALHKLCD